jgi:predicted nucleic acid-binding protein
LTVVYVDTSVLVALIVPEPHSAAVARWYGRTRAELVSAAWCVTEFASALGIKQRTGQIDVPQAQEAWQRFGRLMANDLALLPLVAANFQRAAVFALDALTALRAGDALHLACAEQAGARNMATLDTVLGRNAQRLKIKPIVFS